MNPPHHHPNGKKSQQRRPRRNIKGNRRIRRWADGLPKRRNQGPRPLDTVVHVKHSRDSLRLRAENRTGELALTSGRAD